jgi:hypothetical protein
LFDLAHSKDDIDRRLKIIAMERTAIPDFILNKPKLAMGLEFYYEAFNNLCSERQMGEHGVFGLSWSIIQRYADHYELDFEEGEKFHYLISKMDIAYCNRSNKK